MSDTKHTPGPWHWDGDAIWAANGSKVLFLDYTHATHGNPDLRAPNPLDALSLIAAPDLLAAVEAALPFLEPLAEGASAYGSFPGGDPRKFSPDEESNTPEEMAAWKAACDQWNAGNPVDDGSHGCKPLGIPAPDGTIVHGFACGSSFGVGVYTWVDPAAERALSLLKAALAKARGEAA